jgi:signal peptidase
VLGFVETGSMAPTLQPGDGFVAIPATLAGPVESGDVVTFRAEQIQGGGLTTHRVVDETERGYVTRGDANPFTDQDGGEPPVQEAQVVAVAWKPGGTVLAIPHAGTAVQGIRAVLAGAQRWLAVQLGTRSVLGTSGLAYLVLAVSMGWYAVEAYRDQGTERDRERTRSRDDGTDPRLFAAAVTLVVVLSATAAMVGPAGTQEYEVVSAEFESERPTVIRAGGEASLRYAVPNAGVVPVVTYLEPGSEGVAVEPGSVTVGPRSVANATATLSAPPETGLYRRFVTEHRYLALLPRAHIDALYRVHPWLPIVAVDALVGVPFYVASVALLGRGRVRSYSRPGPSRTRRLLNRLR